MKQKLLALSVRLYGLHVRHPYSLHGQTIIPKCACARTDSQLIKKNVGSIQYNFYKCQICFRVYKTVATFVNCTCKRITIITFHHEFAISDDFWPRGIFRLVLSENPFWSPILLRIRYFATPSLLYYIENGNCSDFVERNDKVYIQTVLSRTLTVFWKSLFLCAIM